jgi:hypothetical protein
MCEYKVIFSAKAGFFFVHFYFQQIGCIDHQIAGPLHKAKQMSLRKKGYI